MLYVFFVSPYFDHDAFMHHTMHVLDAPAWNFWSTNAQWSQQMVSQCNEWM